MGDAGLPGDTCARVARVIPELLHISIVMGQRIGVLRARPYSMTFRSSTALARRPHSLFAWFELRIELGQG